MGDDENYPTILSKLTYFAKTTPTKHVWSFLNDNCEIIDKFTFLELEQATDELAYHLLHTYNLRPGERALLVFFPGLAFTASLLACFKAGIIAVPVFPPDPRKLQKDLDHFISIQSSSQAQIVLTHNLYNYAKKVHDLTNIFSLKSNHQAWPSMKWIVVDDVLNKGKSKASSTSVINIIANPIAFLQYTSGSTSEPKGVMISHQNLAHNLKLATTALRVDQETINVSWLPQYHDMGLIGSYLGALYCGGTGYYLSPISFLKDPNCWLRALSQYRGSHTQAPNFAYALAARKFREYMLETRQGPLDSLDLSCVRHMINAAEPVDVEAISQFYALFQQYGLQLGVVVPTYGLAEHTVFVCSDGITILHLDKVSLENGKMEIISESTLDIIQPPPQKTKLKVSIDSTTTTTGTRRTQSLVGCGFFEKSGVDIRIVDPTTGLLLSDGVVGEIWVNSASKAQGYWNQPDLSNEVFRAHITPAPEITATTTTTTTEGKEDSQVTQPDNENDIENKETTATTTEATAKATTAIEEEESNKETVLSTTRPPPSPQTTYLRTGDMGFVHKDELFLCGRIKDLIIIRGSNHYPQDIERTAEHSSSHLRQGCSAAFAIPHEAGHTEMVVFICELKKNTPAMVFDSIVVAIRSAVNKEHGVSLSVVVLIDTKSIVKTTSGKISRNGCKKAFLKKSLTVLHLWESPISVEEQQQEEESKTDGSDNASMNSSGKAFEINNSFRGNLNVSMNSSGKGFGLQSNQVEMTDISNSTASTTGGKTTTTTQQQQQRGGGMQFTKEELRSKSVEEIVKLLESTVVAVSSQGPSPVVAPIETDKSMVSLGLDSFTIVQFKGALDKRYFCELPDEYLFTNLATLSDLAIVVKHGSLTHEQREKFESVTPATNGGAATTTGTGGSDRGKGKKAAVVVESNTPCCPWFTCCY